MKGMGELHLDIKVDILKRTHGVEVEVGKPQVAYREAISKRVEFDYTHKKQTGGSGQYGRVSGYLEPYEAGDFEFINEIRGGAITTEYIPAVEKGFRMAMAKGRLIGFPITGLRVVINDGASHAVDSSDMAFRKAAQQAMREGMPNCQPVLLEPICKVVISMPSEFTSRMQRLVSGRRGQIMGFDAKPGWAGWDEVQVQLPQSEMHDLVIELRSMTMGVGTFEWAFDHLQELMGKEADQVVALRAQAAQ